MDCRIVSLSQTGTLVWTNSHTNIHAGFQFAEQATGPWQPTPPPFWNVLLTSHSNQTQLPPEALGMQQLYLRLVISTNDLGSGLPVYHVPQRTMLVDASTNDWNEVQPAIVDPAGDGNALPGSDMLALYVARDAQNIYVRLDLANGPPSSQLYFGVSFNRSDDIGERFIFVQMSTLQCSVDQWVDDQYYHTPVTSGSLAVGQTVIELSVPANELHLPTPAFLNAWNDVSGPSIDETQMIELQFE